MIFNLNHFFTCPAYRTIGDTIRRMPNPKLAALLADRFSEAGIAEADILSWLQKKANN